AVAAGAVVVAAGAGAVVEARGGAAAQADRLGLGEVAVAVGDDHVERARPLGAAYGEVERAVGAQGPLGAPDDPVRAEPLEPELGAQDGRLLTPGALHRRADRGPRGVEAGDGDLAGLLRLRRCGGRGGGGGRR